MTLVTSPPTSLSLPRLSSPLLTASQAHHFVLPRVTTCTLGREGTHIQLCIRSFLSSPERIIRQWSVCGQNACGVSQGVMNPI